MDERQTAQQNSKRSRDRVLKTLLILPQHHIVVIAGVMAVADYKENVEITHAPPASTSYPSAEWAKSLS